MSAAPRAWAALIVLAVVLCYANSLHAPFLMDDPHPGVRLEYRLRPLVWASFAMNRWLSGSATWSFHVYNALVHAGCALLLLGVLRRTMERVAPALDGRTRDGLALVTTLCWACHPLQTGAVTYLSQRAESMAALAYLAALYAFLRSASAARPWAWQALTLAALALGFASKEIVATAPLILFLYDALFLSSGPRAALRQRRGFYGVLALVTLGLGLVFIAPPLLAEQGTMGLRLREFGPLEYARTQPGVILHYLRLVFWPQPLCFDYGWPIARSAGDYLPQGALVAALVLASAVLLWRRSWIGFTGAFFFVVLAPTSSFVPIKDPAFEHRVYLPLAAVLTLVVVAGWWLLTRPLRCARRLAPVLAGAVVLGLAALTVRRNQDYRTAVGLMQATVACAPHHARARSNLGTTLLEAGRTREAIAEFYAALAIDAYDHACYLNLGSAYLRLGETERALPFLERAVELRTGAIEEPRCRDYLGQALLVKGDPAGAAAQFQRALELDPRDALVRERLATALGRVQGPPASTAEPKAPSEADRRGQRLVRAGDLAGAVAAFQEALELDPDDAGIRFRLANALNRWGRPDEAIAHYRAALRLDPGIQEAHINLAALLAERDEPEVALEHCQKALAIQPNSPEEHFNLAQALRSLGRFDEAMAALLEASRLAPGLPEPYSAYAKTVCMKPDASPDERREALRLAQRANEMTHSTRPDFLEVCAQAQAALGDYESAAALIDEALELPGPTRNQTFANRLRAQREDYLRRARE